MKWTDTVTTLREERLSQGAISTTIDSLVASGVMSVPEHIKIDVDGLEHRVVAAGRRPSPTPRCGRC